MSSIVVVGTQWGDEGKGKITDFLAEQSDVIARFSGGNNAGHTIQFGGETYKLHLVPSGIFYKDKLAVIGNGVVVDPVALLKELDGLNERGIPTSNLRISNRAQVILPYHLAQDEYEERLRGDNKIGTTKKGIGPAYVDKVQRIGIRMADLLEKETFERLLKSNIEYKQAYFKGMFNETCPSFDDIFEEYYA
ncbi:adenylosuccinate synthetase, partial [Staphylococcus aureus]|nr:adenylosuccinate synthetase [Staphylococcus aureus]